MTGLKNHLGTVREAVVYFKSDSDSVENTRGLHLCVADLKIVPRIWIERTFRWVSVWLLHAGLIDPHRTKLIKRPK